MRLVAALQPVRLSQLRLANLRFFPSRPVRQPASRLRRHVPLRRQLPSQKSRPTTPFRPFSPTVSLWHLNNSLLVISGGVKWKNRQSFAQATTGPASTREVDRHDIGVAKGSQSKTGRAPWKRPDLRRRRLRDRGILSGRGRGVNRLFVLLLSHFGEDSSANLLVSTVHKRGENFVEVITQLLAIETGDNPCFSVKGGG